MWTQKCDQMLEIKETRSFQKLALSNQSNFSTYLKVAQKLTNIWANINRQFVAKNFQKLPNLVTPTVVDHRNSTDGGSYLISAEMNLVADYV